MVNFKFEYKKRGANINWKLLPDDAGGIALTGNIDTTLDYVCSADDPELYEGDYDLCVDDFATSCVDGILEVIYYTYSEFCISNISEFEDFIKDAIFTSVATFFEGRKK